MNTQRFLTWFSFIIIVGLIVWGLVVAQKKATLESARIILPDEIVATDHVQGNESAKVDLVEYGDFQCPACAVFHPIVKKLIEEAGPDKIRFVFRHFPLTQHANAVPAAQASEAAGKQGKFWEMYDMLYVNQDEWKDSTNTQEIYTGYAKKLNLDIEKFTKDYSSKEVRDTINNDYKGGVKAKIMGTPTFFVNGRQINNPNTYEAFKKIIDDAVLPTNK